MIVSTLVLPASEGVIVAGANEHDTPGGSVGAKHDRVTGCPVPVVSVAVIVLVPDMPLIAVMGPELDRE